MTIALGILCVDGVVLATDTQYSIGTTLGTTFKYQGLKLFRLTTGGAFQVIVAGCDNPNAFKRAVEAIREGLRALEGKQPTVDVVKSMIEDSLGKFFAKFIDPIPREDREHYGFQLVIGISAKSETARLFHSDRAMLVEDHHCSCLGEGQYVAEYAIGLVVPLKPTVELAKCLAAYVASVAKRYISSVGGPSKVYALHNDGSDSMLLPLEIHEIEECFDEVGPAFQFALGAMDTELVPDQLFEVRTDLVHSAIAHYRVRKMERLRKHKEWRDKLLNPEAQPSPQPPKVAD